MKMESGLQVAEVCAPTEKLGLDTFFEFDSCFSEQGGADMHLEQYMLHLDK